jgi:hypothetical protein
MRFRPRATFNPYVGAGIGYSIIGFEPSHSFDQLSLTMDSSRGAQTRLTPFFSSGFGGVPKIQTGEFAQIDLQGATIDARDSFEWHLVGGAEVTFKKRWSAFVDLRWVDASRSFAVGFNGGAELGRSVPNYQPLDSSAMANASYGPVDVGGCVKSSTVNANGELIACSGGGLLDYGYPILVPADDAPATTHCDDPTDALSALCVADFVFEPDGVVDPGLYYAQGGKVSYDGYSLLFGIRFTLGK